MKNSCDTIVVGAGIAGLIAARELIGARHEVIVVEADRRVGGRMAAVSLGRATFDSGAQFISVRSAELEQYVAEWIDAGVATLWAHGFADGLTGDGSLARESDRDNPHRHMPARDGHPRYRGVPAMDAIPRHLARGLDVRLGVTVHSIGPHPEGGWRIDADAGRFYRASSVIVTAPVPLSLQMLRSGGTPIEESGRMMLESIEYAPCLSLLGVSEGPADLPRPGALRRPVPAIDWIADNAVKGVSSTGPALTIHCSEAFSTRYFERDDGDVVRQVILELEDTLPLRFSAWRLDRWRHSRPVHALQTGTFTTGLPVGVCIAGDAFSGARIEGAVLSGTAAARATIARPPDRPDGS